MKIVELSRQEFEALDKDDQDRVFFQGKRFSKDFDFSRRVYQRTLDALRTERNDTALCLVIEIQGVFSVWHEAKDSPVLPSAPIAADPRTLQASNNQPANNTITNNSGISSPAKDLRNSPQTAVPAPAAFTPVPLPRPTQPAAPFSSPSLSASSQEEIASLVAPVVEYVVEEVLSRKKQISLQQLADIFGATISDAALAAQLAQKVLTELEKAEAIASSQSASSQSASSQSDNSQSGSSQSIDADSATAQQMNPEPANPESAASPETSQQRKSRRFYRGIPY